MKAKNGISLIVLVITIVVIIILAAAVILSLGQNNPINNSRVAAVSTTRDNLQSAVALYLSTKFAKYSGEYSADQVLSGKIKTDTSAEGFAESSNSVPGIANPVIDLTKELAPNTGYYEVSVANAKTELEIELPDGPTVTEKWYVSPSTGKAMVKYTAIPSYLKEGDNLLDSVATFVTE